MVQQTFSGVPDDLAVGDLVKRADYAALREFILAVVKDGTESTTGQTSKLLMDATDGSWELDGAPLGQPQSWTPNLTFTGGVGGSITASAAEGTYVQVGRMVTVWARYVIDTNTAAGDLICNLPVNADTSLDAINASTASNEGTPIGVSQSHDDSDNGGVGWRVGLRTASTVHFQGTNGVLQADDSNLTSSGDALLFTATYPVASA